MRRRLWPHGRADQSAALAVALAVALVLLIAFPGFGRAPGDPTLFAKDARVDRCGGLEAPVSYIFELPHTRDYRSYLPAMEPSVLLDLDDPSLVVIFQGQGPFTADSRARPQPGPGSRRCTTSASTWARPAPASSTTSRTFRSRGCGSPRTATSSCPPAPDDPGTAGRSGVAGVRIGLPIARLETARDGHQAAVDRDQVGLGNRPDVGHRHAQQHLAFALEIADGAAAQGRLLVADRPAELRSFVERPTIRRSRASIRRRRRRSSGFTAGAGAAPCVRLRDPPDPAPFEPVPSATPASESMSDVVQCHVIPAGALPDDRGDGDVGRKLTWRNGSRVEGSRDGPRGTAAGSPSSASRSATLVWVRPPALTIGGVEVACVQPVDQGALVVRLEEVELEAQLGGVGGESAHGSRRASHGRRSRALACPAGSGSGPGGRARASSAGLRARRLPRPWARDLGGVVRPAAGSGAASKPSSTASTSACGTSLRTTMPIRPAAPSAAGPRVLLVHAGRREHGSAIVGQPPGPRPSRSSSATMRSARAAGVTPSHGRSGAAAAQASGRRPRRAAARW